jgi:ATP-dependent DNA helicase RecG
VLLYRHPAGPLAKQRLTTMYESNDGFEIARRDLALRGPGEFLGARQSGALLLRFADLERDADLVDAARNAAQTMLQRYPVQVAAHLLRWLGSREEFLKA